MGLLSSTTKVLVGLGLVAGLSSASPSKMSDKQFFCQMLKIYDFCNEKAKKEDIYGDEEKCKEAGLEFGRGIYQMLKDKGVVGKGEKEKEASLNFAAFVGVICYSGCMEDGNVREKLYNKCHPEELKEPEGKEKGKK